MIELFFDGACAPWNPGGVATYGFVVRRDGKVLAEGKGVAAEPGGPMATNNVAEYTAVLRGLEDLGWYLQPAEKIEIRGDSQLVIRQLTGEYKVKAEHLKGVYSKAAMAISELRSKGHPLNLEWIQRENNGHADRLSKEEVVRFLAEKPSILDGVVLTFGKHKGKKWGEVPAEYRQWLATQ